MAKSKTTITQRRSKYVDYAAPFVKWVESLGFQPTALQQWRHFFIRFQVRHLVLVFGFSLILSIVLFTNFHLNYHATVGSTARTDIVAPVGFRYVDNAATAKLRQKARQNVPPVFDYNLDIYEEVAGRVSQAFRVLREQAQGRGWLFHRLSQDPESAENKTLRHLFDKEIGVPVPREIWNWLVASDFSSQIENALIRILDNWSELRIAAEPGRDIGSSPEISVRTVEDGGPSEEILLNPSEIRDMSRREEFREDAQQIAQDFPRLDRTNIIRLSNLLVVPNLIYNIKETKRRRSLAEARVKPVVLNIKKNQVLVPAGSVIDQSKLNLIYKAQDLGARHLNRTLVLLSALFLTFLILVFFSYLRRFTLNRVRIVSKDLYAMAFVTFIVVALVKSAMFFTGVAFGSKFGHVIPAEALMFVAPVAAGPMLVGLLISSGEVVWLFTIFLAAALGLMVDYHFAFMMVSIAGGIAGARGVYACKKRNDIYWAGMRTGFINAAMIALVLASTEPSGTSLSSLMLWSVPAGFISGILSALIAMMLIPLLESIFNYTTDVKLLELSNLNHPLLKKMIVQAPGTYHHSLVVGSMVEAAAEEIGANSLLAKVMAYYHDIGKMDHSAYFIENQKPGHNPHDSLSPHMSKTVLVAHIKDGAELALRYKLGRPIIDGILQHHGTTLISFFYNKAVEMHNDEIDPVNEDDFRYPGPKPQFREAALCMIADSIEAAARSLDEPTPTRLQNIVKNIIQRKFMDGQLEQCNLTLRDLSVIEAAFIRVLLGIYHQRIDYPRKAGGGASETPQPVTPPTPLKLGRNTSA